MKKYLGEIICVLFIIGLLLTACSLPKAPPANDCVEYAVDTQAAIITDRDCIESLDHCVLWVECDRYTGSVIVSPDVCERFAIGDTIVIDILTDKGNGRKKVQFAY
jgi:hypothetical protein